MASDTAQVGHYEVWLLWTNCILEWLQPIKHTSQGESFLTTAALENQGAISKSISHDPEVMKHPEFNPHLLFKWQHPWRLDSCGKPNSSNIDIFNTLNMHTWPVNTRLLEALNTRHLLNTYFTHQVHIFNMLKRRLHLNCLAFHPGSMHKCDTFRAAAEQ